MPTYVYRCGKCGQTFERSEHVAEHGRGTPPCPRCGSGQQVAHVIQPFYAKTAKKS